MSLFIVLLILLGSGIVLSMAFRTRWQYPIARWLGTVQLLGLGTITILAIAMFAVASYRQSHVQHREVLPLTDASSVQVGMRGGLPPSSRSVVIRPFDDRPTDPSAISWGSVRTSTVQVTWISGLRAVALGVSCLLTFMGAAWLRRAVRCRPATLTVDRPPNTRRSTAWLVVPTLCLAVLGYLARPALLPSIDGDLVRKSAALSEQQVRTEKVLGELLDKTSSAADQAQPIPDWLRNRPLASGQLLLSSGQFSSPQEAEHELLPHAAYLLQRAFHETHPWEGTWTVPLGQVRERVVDKQFVEHHTKTIGKFSGEIYRLHILVHVSPAVCETFTSEWKSQIVRRRLEVLGVLLGWITGLLFLATLYFRRAAHLENLVGGLDQLKISAWTMCLTAAAAWMLINVHR